MGTRAMSLQCSDREGMPILRSVDGSNSGE